MNKWKTIIMSDLHLGAIQSQSDKILEFLENNEAETIILNGDIVDGWALKRGSKWKKNHSKIVRKLMKKAEEGTKIIYIYGNHDDFMHQFVPFQMGNFDFVREYGFKGVDGRLYYCFHGDVLDFVVIKMRWLAIVGGWSYDFVIRLNTLYNFFRRKFNLPYHSLANIIKKNVKGLNNFLERFEKNATKLTKQKGYDVAVCGHIHQPKIETNYMNSGDFCENSTCLVETSSGKWIIYQV
jgi:UDP-2,3-diacylglucosamine pyrophosphatase LpxH